MPSRSSVSMCSALPRRASSAACRRGWRVLTRPSRISSWPVNSETSVTSIPAPRSSAAVPPVLRISTPKPARLLAKSATPVLSETEMSARRTLTAPSSATSDRVSAGASLIDRYDPGVGVVDPNPALGDHAHPLRVELVLQGVDRPLQLFAVAALRDGDLALDDRRAGVDSLVDEVHGDAGLLGAGGERLADRVEAREVRQQRRVDVDD